MIKLIDEFKLENNLMVQLKYFMNSRKRFTNFGTSNPMESLKPLPHKYSNKNLKAKLHFWSLNYLDSIGLVP